MEQIEAEKSKPPQRPPPPHFEKDLEAEKSKPPQRSPRRPKVPKRPTARVNPIPIPDRNHYTTINIRYGKSDLQA